MIKKFLDITFLKFVLVGVINVKFESYTTSCALSNNSSPPFTSYVIIYVVGSQCAVNVLLPIELCSIVNPFVGVVISLVVQPKNV